MNELHLFAGAGGGILGGLLLGHTPVCAVEIEPYCRKVLLQRQRDGILPWFPIWDDVRTFDGKPWRGIADVVCGGFPCQDISAAGHGKGLEGERSGLWGEMLRIIGEVRPKYTFIENSPILVIRGLHIVIADLAKLGYDCRWGIIGASDVGAIHERKRIWILGSDPTQIRRFNTTNEVQSKTLESFKFWSESAFSSLLAFEKPQYEVQSEDQRMGDGLAFGMEQFAAIGNGQVPGVAAMAWNVLIKRILA